MSRTGLVMLEYSSATDSAKRSMSWVMACSTRHGNERTHRDEGGQANHNKVKQSAKPRDVVRYSCKPNTTSYAIITYIRGTCSLLSKSKRKYINTHWHTYMGVKATRGMYGLEYGLQGKTPSRAVVRVSTSACKIPLARQDPRHTGIPDRHWIGDRPSWTRHRS